MERSSSCKKNGRRNGNWMLLYSNWMRCVSDWKWNWKILLIQRKKLSNIGIYWLYGNLCRLMGHEAVCYVCKHRDWYQLIGEPVRVFIDFTHEYTTNDYVGRSARNDLSKFLVAVYVETKRFEVAWDSFAWMQSAHNESQQNRLIDATFLSVALLSSAHLVVSRKFTLISIVRGQHHDIKYFPKWS